MKKLNWKRILVIFIAILFILILISLIDNTLLERHDYPVIDLSDFNTSANCSNTDTGWKCTFDTSKNLLTGNDRYIFERQISDSYKEKCNEQGGVWRCYGFCMANYNHYCDFKFRDAGSICFVSWQCGGKCIVKNGNIGFIVGECSEHILRGCDNYIEIFLGIPFSNFVLCD